MKQFTLIFITFLLSVSVYAQDIITLRNGNEIKAKVLEISNTEVKYKRFDNLQEATIAIPSIDVFFILYENGTREVITPLSYEAPQQQQQAPSIPQTFANTNLIYWRTSFWKGLVLYTDDNDNLSRNDIRRLLQTNQRALQLYDKSIRQRNTSLWLMLPYSVLLGVGTYFVLDDNMTGATTCYVAGLGFGIYGIVLANKSGNNLLESINTYNRGVHNSTNITLKFGITGNGIGLVLNF